MEEIRCIERDGIPVDIPNFHVAVRFTVIQVVGDNLGLNAILDYTESFTGNYVCQWHKASRDVLRVHSHEAALHTADPSKTGLKRDSILNSLSFFLVRVHVAPDIMHDVLEGVGPYEVKLVLNSLIEQKHLTLDKLHYRITNF